MGNRDFFDDRYFVISARLDALRSEVADERRAAAPRRTNVTTVAPTARAAHVEPDMCAGRCEPDPSRQPA